MGMGPKPLSVRTRPGFLPRGDSIDPTIHARSATTRARLARLVIPRVARLPGGQLSGVRRRPPRPPPSVPPSSASSPPSIIRTCMLHLLASVDGRPNRFQFCVQRPVSVWFFASDVRSKSHINPLLSYQLLAPLAINRTYQVHFLNQDGRWWLCMVWD
jgi:hypothetical protein